MITSHVTDGIASLELNRPEVRNAINKELCDAVSRTLDLWARSRERIRA